MKRKDHKPGTFLRVPLADGAWGYGRILHPPYDAFYDYRTERPEADLDKVAAQEVLFKAAVRYAKPSSWERIGWREIEARLKEPVVQFRQDVGNFLRCTIFDTTGNSRAATPQECVGLERAAVWEQHSIEERLLDHFMGRPNETVENLKVCLEEDLGRL